MTENSNCGYTASESAPHMKYPAPDGRPAKRKQGIFRKQRMALLIALCFGPVAPSAQADSVMWHGGISRNWHDNNNWIWDGHTPTIADTATINSNSGNTPEIGSGSNASANLLVVGGSSHGSLSILGTLNTNSALLGNDNGGQTALGTVTIDGAGATWTNSNSLYVGNYSLGVLNIQGGANVGTTAAYLGSESGSNGQITLSGNGSALNASGHIHIGYAGTGSLTVGANTTVNSASATLGSLAGGTGTVDINGGNWSNGGGTLSIGNAGTGSLLIQNGGTVSNGVGTIGSSATSLGNTVTVTGGSSNWSSSGRLYVGIYGGGTLSVQNGASVDSVGGVISRYAGSTGSATISGAGSSWTITDSLHIGGDIADASNPGGTGVLNINNGGSVSSQAAFIGDTTNATGTVTVNQGTWTLSDRLGVGNYGTGTLTIENGGTVNSTGGIVGWNASSSGNSVAVSGNGSLWSMSGHLFVGNLGQGTLNITNGGDVSNNDGYVGSENNAQQSQITVSGSGSTWTNNGTVFVAHNTGSNGQLTISGGGVVTATQQGIIGDLAGATGSATVTGTGSSWSVAQDFNVGRHGNGSLSILNGGAVSSDRAYIANNTGSSGSVVVSGSGSSWTSTGVLHVGSQGSGTLLLSNGGTVNAGSLHVAHATGSTGVLSIGATEGQAAAAAGQINAGTLTLGSGSATVVLNHNESNYTVASAILGNGTLKVLSGHTTLTASNTFTGSTQIAAGASLTLGATASLGSSVSIANGALLTAGSNALGGNVTNSGTLNLTRVDTNYPQLTIAGNFVQGAAGRTEIAAFTTTAGQYSRISTGGSATLDGALNIDVTTGSPLAAGNTLLQVINASGGVSGRFSSITDNSALFNFAAIYGTNAVDLTLIPESPNGISNAVQTTGNSPAQGAAGILDSLITNNPGGSLAALFIPLTNTQQISEAVSQTLPLLTGSTTVATQGTLSSINRIIQTRLGDRVGQSSGDQAYGNGYLWIKPFASRMRQGTASNVAGYEADVLGLTLGTDRQLTDRSVLGLALSYANADVDSLSGTAPNNNKIDLYRLLGYGSSEIGESTYINWQLDFGNNSNRGRRQIPFAGVTARSSFDTLSAHAGIRLQKRLDISHRTTLLPSIGLDYTWLRDSAYTEKGAGALNLSVESERSEQTLVSSDMSVSHRLDDGFDILGNIGLAYDVNARQASLVASYAGAPGASFVTQGIKPKRLTARAGLGLSKVTETGMTILTRLDAERRENYTNYSASVNLRWMF